MSSPEIPLAVILSLLDNPEASTLSYILKSLYQSKHTITKASKSEINHLIAKTTNLLNSKNGLKRWYGSHVVQILAMNPIILTNGGTGFIVALLKIINEIGVPVINFTNAALGLDKLIQGIRGKPVLTREILTPNLPNIISSLIENLNKDLYTVLPILKKLLFKNTTTFKPFINKFETKLNSLLINNFHNVDESLKSDIVQSYAYLNLVKPSQNSNQGGQNVQSLPDDQWRLKIFKILDELRSTVLIYDNLVELKNDRDIQDLLNQLPENESNTKDYIFPFLQIDLTEPITVIQISQRIEVLSHLIIAFLTSPTPFALRIPLGLVIQSSILLLSISPNYIPFQKDVGRNDELKKIITNDLAKTQSHGSMILYEITKTYKKLVLPHLESILSSLEVVIPIKNEKGSKRVKINQDSCLAIEPELLLILKTTVELMKQFQGINDLDLINKLIDVSILFLQKRTPLDDLLEKQDQKQQQSQSQNKSQKKKTKNKDSTPLSDVLSHAELFELNAPKETVNIIQGFFEVVIKRIPNLTPNSRIKIVKYVISTATLEKSTRGLISDKLTRLLEAIVLYPSEGETYSILPIAKRLLSNNEVLSLLTNPRFPPLETKFKQSQIQEQVEEQEDEDEDEEIVDAEPQIIEEPKHLEVSDVIQEATKTKQVPISEQETKQSMVFKKNDEIKDKTVLTFASEQSKTESEEESANKTRSLEEKDDDEDTPSKRMKIISEGSKTVQIPENKIGEEEESDSDFEIPNIDIGSDEDEE
ncbi:Pre-rRNA-processing protein [Wickerhamomyces ciferrii]|uniref:Pre-rRNA-processing protein RIX1 n=1 Tax=Wickerhamomyces ciferrii (strain ATCC 14091 / BCRC 22168 / CBS 111 / JCM 3599 / NBRC 0793 / NRRL Y-1031 F-60-10) TaxID=1206466 RepID=K0KMR3_WICCF|nr:Pre-rRNA-processing protein [Wickerhamomyces ciferrii]CCH42408.1 Pre-rRNA-processing protein [Wickerhamomyces ciferrii]